MTTSEADTETAGQRRKLRPLQMSASRSHHCRRLRFTAQMALEHAKEEQKDKQRRLQEELQKFMEAALGPRARQPTGAIKRHS